LLVAPSAYHRMEFRLRDRAHLVSVGNRLSLAGFAFLGLAMTSAVLLVTRYLFSELTTIVVVALVGGLFAVLWYLLPLRRRLRRRAELASEHGG
jgi:Flp pilus assembly protein TadB